MNNCIFCQFGGNKLLIPDQFIAENRESFIMLSLHPQTKGHLLIISKAHFSKLSEISNVLQGRLFSEAIEMGEKLKKRLKAKAYVIKVNNELYKLESGKGHVGHIHLHVIPRYKAGEKLSDNPKKVSDLTLKLVKNKLTGTE